MATIDLGLRPRPGGQQMPMSASSAPADRFRAFLDVPDGRHLQRRVRGVRRHVTRAFVQVVAAVAWLGLTLINTAREWTMHVATAGSFVVAGFTMTPALGWVVLGFTLLWTQSMIDGDDKG